MIKEFKQFISRGNVIDLAIGVIIGSAFGKIVSSLVDDVLMPLIGICLGGLDFKGLSINIGNASINYGMFIQNVIDFLIISFCIFMFIKIINKVTRINTKKEEKLKPENIVLLEEIRDILKKNR